MIIIKLQGGLGNQMFQYAFGRHLQEKHKSELKFDISEYEVPSVGPGVVQRDYDLDIFGITVDAASRREISALRDRIGIPVVDRLLCSMLGRKSNDFVELPLFHFREEIYNAPDNAYFEGYWQTEKYFADIEKLIRQEFTIREPLQRDSEGLLAKISQETSVCVNVRRGDFVTNDRHGWFGTEYFTKGERIIEEHVSDHRFYVFSDDIYWCQENLRFARPTTFVSHEFAGRKFQDYLRLMAACKHFIIPNSSFAWWAVWLNDNPHKVVVAPRRWFNVPELDPRDIFQPEWILI
jgi:hypothetical protein